MIFLRGFFLSFPRGKAAINYPDVIFLCHNQIVDWINLSRFTSNKNTQNEIWNKENSSQTVYATVFVIKFHLAIVKTKTICAIDAVFILISHFPYTLYDIVKQQSRTFVILLV